MDFLGILSAAGIIVGLFAAAGVGLQRGLMTNLRESRDEYEKENTKLKTDRAEDRATIERLTRDLDALRRVVTGEVHLTAILDLLGHHHQSHTEHRQMTEEQWREARPMLDQILEAIRRIPHD